MFRTLLETVNIFCLYYYRVWVPNNVGQLFANSFYEVENENDQQDERTEDSPRGLPEEVGLFTNHELHVLVKPNGKDHVNQKLQCQTRQSLIDDPLTCQCHRRKPPQAAHTDLLRALG